MGNSPLKPLVKRRLHFQNAWVAGYKYDHAYLEEAIKDVVKARCNGKVNTVLRSAKRGYVPDVSNTLKLLFID